MGWFRLSPISFGKYGLVLLAATFAWRGYDTVRPEDSSLDPLRSEAASRIAEQASAAISDFAGSEWSGRYVKVARIQGDHDGQIRTLLEKTLPAQTNCLIVRDSLLSEMRDGVSDTVAHVGLVQQSGTDTWKHKPATNLSEALSLAKAAKVDYVVYGTVEDFRVVDGDVHAELEIRLADSNQLKEVMVKRFIKGADPVYHSDVGATKGQFVRNIMWKCMVWCLFVLSLPVVTTSFWVAVLDHESNASTFFALLFLTCVDGLFASVLMGLTFSSVWAAILLGLSTCVAFIWNFFMLGMLEQHRMHEPHNSTGMRA